MRWKSPSLVSIRLSSVANPPLRSHQNVAQRSVYINTAMLLWSFTMRHKKDSQGVDISIDNLAFTRSANWHPLPFFCEFTPRFEGVRKILESIDL